MPANQVSFDDPYSLDAERIRRNQLLAMQLSKQAEEPIAPGQMVSGYYVPTSPLEHLARALKGGMARGAMYQGDKEMQGIADRQRQDFQSDRGALAAALQGTPGGISEPDPGNIVNTPAQAPNQQALQQMEFKSPMFRQMQMQRMAAQFAEPQRVDLGDKIGLLRDGQIVGYLPKGVTPDTTFKEAGSQRRHEMPSGSAQLGAQTTLQTHATPSGSTLASNAVAMRGQNMTDARAAQTLAAGKWTNDLERGLQVNTTTGETRPITQGGAPLGQKDKPLTESQGRGQMFGTRAAEADKILSGLEDKISVTGLATKQGLEHTPLVGGPLSAAGNVLLTADQQKVDQAQRNFLNAVLRQESGAVIGPSEFIEGKKQYFPQPGDGPQVIEQKRANRQSAIEGFKLMSGSAGGRIEAARGAQAREAPSVPRETSLAGIKAPIVVDW